MCKKFMQAAELGLFYLLVAACMTKLTTRVAKALQFFLRHVATTNRTHA